MVRIIFTYQCLRAGNLLELLCQDFVSVQTNLEFGEGVF